MNTKNINIDEELESLRDSEMILPDGNFKSEIFSKLRKARNKNSVIVTGSLLLCVLFFNILSVVKLVSHHEEVERVTKLTSVISTFSLDK